MLGDIYSEDFKRANPQRTVSVKKITLTKLNGSERTVSNWHINTDVYNLDHSSVGLCGLYLSQKLEIKNEHQ